MYTPNNWYNTIFDTSIIYTSSFVKNYSFNTDTNPVTQKLFSITPKNLPQVIRTYQKLISFKFL